MILVQSVRLSWMGNCRGRSRGPFGEVGKAHLSHEFPVAAAHPARGIRDVQHPYMDVRGQESKDTAKMSLYATPQPSAKCHQASKYSHRVQRGAQDGTREQPSANTKHRSPRCPCAVTRALG